MENTLRVFGDIHWKTVLVIATIEVGVGRVVIESDVA
jgi:hypothetical protein